MRRINIAKKQLFYAVKEGNKVGIFRTWDECQEAIKGVSDYDKTFKIKEEDKAYMNDENLVLTRDVTSRLNAGEVVAFVNGSFNQSKRIYSYGVCILTPQTQITKPVELCEKGSDEKYVDLGSVAGKILGVHNAVDWAWKNDFSTISIFYDYDGIGKWVNEEWRAKNELSKFYKSYIEEKRELLQINFIKVSGSNNKYNDRASVLAKAAIAENKVMRDSGGNVGYIINNVKDDEIVDTLKKLKLECSGLDYSVNGDENKKIYSIQFNKEKLTIQVFKNIKIVVQGKKSNLFQIITTGIIENISCDDFIKILKDAYEIVIDNVKVENDFKTELPTISNQTLPDNISKLLKQATIDLSNDAHGDIEFSKHTFTVLKALEGILKYNLQKCDVPMKSTSFSMFCKYGGIYKLQDTYSENLSNDKVLKIENCYNHLYSNRHTLFHFGMFIDCTDVNTRMLNTKNEANEIIKSTLKIIDNNCI